MKTSLNSILLAAVIAMTLLFTPSALRAQQAATDPVPVVIAPTVAQYKVIDTAAIAVARGQSGAATLEAILNEYAAQGWKVVASSGAFIILSR